MLIATQGTNVAATRQYFDQVLTQGDYYLGQEVNGLWHGHGANLLGLGIGSDVTKQQFSDLLLGKHPVNGTDLTQRSRKDRRPGMDLTFSVPKSVSLAWAINEDERLIDALREAVRETMECDVEPLMQRRVRTGKHANSEQKATTGKLVYADFLHKTSRPVDGTADPHLHVHAFVINWTEENGVHYAGQMGEIVRQRPSLQAKFESRLASKLQKELGYAVTQTRFTQSGKIKAGWEIDGIDRKTIEKYSRRTAQVEQHANENGIHGAAEKGSLGKKTREKKDNGASVEKLRDEWQSRLTNQERLAFSRLLDGKRIDQGEDEQSQAIASVKYALDHHLFRQSTVERHQIVGTALEHALTIKPEQIEDALNQVDKIERSMPDHGCVRDLITTREVLNAEKRLIDYARDGRGTRKAIGDSEHQFSRTWLNDQQKDAVRHVVRSRDAVMAVTGGAGTGKSSLMQEAAEAIAKFGKTVYTFAPSTGAKEVLQQKGFGNAQTVEHLIRNTELHAEVRDQVLWIDEAGLMDVRSMNAVFKIAKEQNARVILSGDTRQHSSPSRGEAMRLLEREAGLNIARVEAIQRQKGRYKAAVELISRGNEVVNAETGQTGLLAGFDALDALGKIHEIDLDERHEKLAENYLAAEKAGKSTLVVAPTHAEAASLTENIRTSLRDEGALSNDEREFIRLKSLNLTNAEKSEAITYASQSGGIVQFHQNAKGGFKRGSRYRIAGAIGKEVFITPVGGGEKQKLPLAASERFEVYAEHKIAIAAGDKIRFSLGGTARGGKQRISNGRLDEVKGFDKSGNLILKNGWIVERDYGHMDLGYVITSHASQGKDRHIAMAAMGESSLPAINAKQFYVTVSRGSEDVMIFVNDKAKIRQAIMRSGEQLSATEMMKQAADSREQKSPSPEPARHQQDAKQSRHAWRSFRDRVVGWWRGETREQQISPDTRHRPLNDRGRTVATGMMFPELGRSI
ncbi:MULTISPECIES: MobF family relaxase [Rhodopirellula]|uniref:MobF family relaxase n=1 Tax=Rhodopirellula TaxID=265488 RepID=UPI00257CA146|nr:MobF family relaxase [Rhodopirellula sp. UBA1907]